MTHEGKLALKSNFFSILGPKLNAEKLRTVITDCDCRPCDCKTKKQANEKNVLNLMQLPRFQSRVSDKFLRCLIVPSLSLSRLFIETTCMKISQSKLEEFVAHDYAINRREQTE